MYVAMVSAGLFLLLIHVHQVVAASTHRKEIRNMTAEEANAYFDAILVYKYEGRQDGKDYMVTYDDLVAQHGIAALNTTVDQAHEYAAFAIWHSIMVREFEIALQSINPDVYVPYWDWTVDSKTADPAKSVVFTSEYFGSSAGPEDNYVVNSSKLAYFPINHDPEAISGVWWQSPAGYLRGPTNYNLSPYLTRYPGGKGLSLPTSAEYDDCLYKKTYALFWVCTWGMAGSMNDQVEIHAGVHEYAGGEWYNSSDTEKNYPYYGDMYDFDTSPNDPLWFSHHANLDRLHYYWMEYIGDSIATGDDPCGEYYGGDTVYPQPPGHNLWNTFVPPFYAYRSLEEMTTLGGLNISEACYWLSPARSGYTYPAYTNDKYDDYYGVYTDDDGIRMPTVSPTRGPIEIWNHTSWTVANTITVSIATVVVLVLLAICGGVIYLSSTSAAATVEGGSAGSTGASAGETIASVPTESTPLIAAEDPAGEEGPGEAELPPTDEPAAPKKSMTSRIKALFK